MSFIKKMKGMAVINRMPDNDEQGLTDPIPKTKQKKNAKSKGNQPTPLPVYDPMADLTDDARTEEDKEDDYKRKPSCLDHMLFHEKLRILYVVLLCLFIGLCIPYILGWHFSKDAKPDDRGYCGLNITYRMECLPGTEPMNEDVCSQANCCFEYIDSTALYAPQCFHTIPADYSYYVENDSGENVIPPINSLENPKAFTYSLGQAPFNLSLAPKTDTTPYGQEAWRLKVLIQRKGESVVRIKIWDPDHPQDIDDDFIEDFPTTWMLNVTVNSVDGDSFNVSVTRNDEDNEEIFNTVFGPLIYSRDYMEITTRIPTSHLYGLGKRGNFQMIPIFDHNEKWELYNYDDKRDDTYSYSSHPFYMNFDDSGKMHGVYLHNAAPVEIAVNPIPGVIFRALGGSLDIRIFAGPKPQDVSKQYMDMIGMPAMPPFWALGYHLCRTSSSSEDFESAFEGMVNASIPYESDCINARLTYPGSFQEISASDKTRIEALKESGRKFWLVQHSFISPKSSAYEEARNLDLLLKLNSTNGTDVPYFGMIADEAVGYPDFVNDISADWISAGKIGDLYGHADAVLLLKNSPLNEVQLNYTLAEEIACNETYPECCCPSNEFPFLPSDISDINDYTLCSTLQQPTLLGEADVHFRSHNVYGRYQHQRTYELMKSKNGGVRQLVTSQSTFPGSGTFGGNFGGNYLPNFVAQQKGHIHIMQMGLYGVPLTGVPICGSTNKTDDEPTPELCLRGYQTGVFLPFLMSHYEQDHIPRNPPDLPGGIKTQLKYFIRQRYMMLPYIYNIFYETYKEGTPVIRPLFYNFPEDAGSRSVDMQFMLGDGILVTPVYNSIKEGESVQVPAHFPPGCWYEFYKGTLVSRSRYGENTVLTTLLTDLNAHVRGGNIIPMQGNLHEDFNTTAEFRLKPLILWVALPCTLEGNVTTTTSTTPEPQSTTDSTTEQVTEPPPQESFDAYGHLYMDDGITPMDQNPIYHNLTFHADLTGITITRHSGTGAELCPTDPGEESPIGFTTVINEVHIAGLPSIDKVYLDGDEVDEFLQDLDSMFLSVKHLNINWCDMEVAKITWDFK